MDPLIGRVLLDRFEVLRRIGSGGMGAVYVGRQLPLGREVALKILRADLMSNEAVRERFRREAEIIGRLRHPNTIQLIDYGDTPDGLAVMAMELLVGQPLSERLKTKGPLPIRDALRVAYELALALSEAHGLGLVHRDLKPANIFLVQVAGQTHAKVLDFGIARVLDEESTRITSTGQVFGTPRYMSPEQGVASGEVDSRTDLYSLGLIMFECLVGQPPFVAETSIQYLSAHATTPPPKLREHLPEAPIELERLLDACLVKERAQRVQTADAVAEALRRIILRLDGAASGDTVANPTGISIEDLLPARPPPDPTLAPKARDTAPPPVAAPSRPPVTLIAGVVALLLAAVIGAAVLMRPPPVAVAITDAGLAPAIGVVMPPDVGHAPVEPDAGFAVAVATPDAGADERTPTAEDSPDAGEEVAEQKRPKKPKRDPTLPHGITGPRDITIEIDDEASPAVQAAKSCKSNAVPDGPGRLSVTGCKTGCAVLVEGVCGGRTPVSELPTPIGQKVVSVVCGNKVEAETVARLREGKTFEISCR